MFIDYYIVNTVLCCRKTCEPERVNTDVIGLAGIS